MRCARHLKKHGGDVEKVVAVPAGRSTRESLAQLADADIVASIGHLGSASTEDGDADRTASYAVGTANRRRPRFRILRPHAPGGLGASSSPSTPSSIARSPSSRSSTATPTTRQPPAVPSRPRLPAGWSTPGSSRSTAWGPTTAAGRSTRCGSSGATPSRRRSSASTPTIAPRRRRPAVARAAPPPAAVPDVCNAIEYAHSRRRPAPGHQAGQRDRRQARRDARGRLGPGQAARAGVRAPATPASAPWCPARPAAAPRPCPARPGHPGLHEPRAGREATLIASGPVRRLQPRRHPVPPADRQAALRGRRSARCSQGRPGDSRRPASSTRRSTRR